MKSDPAAGKSLTQNGLGSFGMSNSFSAVRSTGKDPPPPGELDVVVFHLGRHDRPGVDHDNQEIGADTSRRAHRQPGRLFVCQIDWADHQPIIVGFGMSVIGAWPNAISLAAESDGCHCRSVARCLRENAESPSRR